jgi:hypothetical protein
MVVETSLACANGNGPSETTQPAKAPTAINAAAANDTKTSLIRRRRR